MSAECGAYLHADYWERALVEEEEEAATRKGGSGERVGLFLGGGGGGSGPLPLSPLRVGRKASSPRLRFLHVPIAESARHDAEAAAATLSLLSPHALSFFASFLSPPSSTHPHTFLPPHPNPVLGYNRQTPTPPPLPPTDGRVRARRSAKRDGEGCGECVYKHSLLHIALPTLASTTSTHLLRHMTKGCPAPTR